MVVVLLVLVGGVYKSPLLSKIWDLIDRRRKLWDYPFDTRWKNVWINDRDGGHRWLCVRPLLSLPHCTHWYTSHCTHWYTGMVHLHTLVCFSPLCNGCPSNIAHTIPTVIPPLKWPATQVPISHHNICCLFVSILYNIFKQGINVSHYQWTMMSKMKDKKSDLDSRFLMKWNIHGSLPLDVLSPNKIILRWVKIDWELPFMPPKSVKTSPIVDNVLLDQYIRVLYTQWNLITWNKTFLAVQPLDVISTPASANF